MDVFCREHGRKRRWEHQSDLPGNGWANTRKHSHLWLQFANYKINTKAAAPPAAFCSPPAPCAFSRDGQKERLTLLKASSEGHKLSSALWPLIKKIGLLLMMLWWVQYPHNKGGTTPPPSVSLTDNAMGEGEAQPLTWKLFFLFVWWFVTCHRGDKVLLPQSDTCYFSSSSLQDTLRGKQCPKVTLRSCPLSLGQFYWIWNLRSRWYSYTFCVSVFQLHLNLWLFDISHHSAPEKDAAFLPMIFWAVFKASTPISLPWRADNSGTLTSARDERAGPARAETEPRSDFQLNQDKAPPIEPTLGRALSTEHKSEDGSAEA